MNHNRPIIALLLAASFMVQPLLFALHATEHEPPRIKPVTDYLVVEQSVSDCDLCDNYKHLSFFSLTFFSLTFHKLFAAYVASFCLSILQEVNVNYWLRGPPVTQ
ncbi:hypothetical protein [Tunicatimonas pelagia]|uniref:hypothetical protein n=1 Tax=Tunicatimonas pelagia TaxID=931531 RepID=UPI0026661ED2|nr:hypothetical protein [Tunicatimonas pelagia]WKN44153.1 hypothetical protein P0M28_04125 [Tunicatimonas pelagia]